MNKMYKMRLAFGNRQGLTKFLFKLKPCGAEIQEQSFVEAGGGKVIDELHLVSNRETEHGFVFHEQNPVDEQIGHKIADHNLIVFHT